MMIDTVVFPVAGLGTRFLPITKVIPKEMLPVKNKPLIHYAYEEAKKAGIKRFIFVFGKNKNALINYFDPNFEFPSNISANKRLELEPLVSGWIDKDDEIIFIRQNEPLGLGHAILCAKNLIAKDTRFAVLLPDELFLHKDQKDTALPLGRMIDDGYKNIIGFDEVEMDLVSNYGVLDMDQEDRILDVVEKPKREDAPSNKIIIGRYILEYGIFDYLSTQQAGKNNEIQLTDSIKRMIKDGYDFKGINVASGVNRFDCGSPDGFILANNFMS